MRASLLASAAARTFLCGGASGRVGDGSVNGATRSSTTSAIGSSLASRLMRDCACVALLAEAIDEALQVRALRILLGLGSHLQTGLLGAPRLELIVAAGVKLKLALAQMQNGIDRIVQKLAVVADDQRGMRIFLQARFQPARLRDRDS